MSNILHMQIDSGSSAHICDGPLVYTIQAAASPIPATKNENFGDRGAFAEPEMMLGVLLPVVDEVAVEADIADAMDVMLVLETVTGILEPLVTGNAVRVVQRLALPGHVPVLFKSLSSGPVGPPEYLKATLALRKLT